MPQNVESFLLDLDKIPAGECKDIPLSCSWTITSRDGILTVIITCLKWTCNYDFCVRVTGSPNVSKQVDLDDHHPLLRSSTDAPNLYKAFPEPQLNTHELDFLEELIEYLDLKVNWSIMAVTHLAYLDLADEKLSGTEPGQDVESFIQIIEEKINFAPGDSLRDAGELPNHTFSKKSLFSS